MPVKFALRFSKNAFVPSFISSVAKHSPNAFISVAYPFFVSSYTALAACIQAAMARGAFVLITDKTVIALLSNSSWGTT